MKLKIDTNGFPELPEIGCRPSGRWVPVPPGFRAALQIASKFTGAHNAIYPWLKHVYLIAGKLYASDNRCIIEIDLGDSSFGDAHLISHDVKLVRARGGDPCEAQLDQTCISLAWPDGSWCKVDRRDAERFLNFDHANRCRALTEKFWRPGQAVTTMDASNHNGDAWHGPSFAKVMSIAETFDPDASPATFSFPNGRGLIVKPSKHKAMK
jgi:hypothetical protein